jgi:hypothetical protein
MCGSVSGRVNVTRISAAFFKNRLRVAVGALVLAIGVVLLLVGDLEQKNRAWSVSLEDAGSLLAGSVALAVVYDIFVKPSQQDEIIGLVDRQLKSPIGEQLTSQRDAIASQVASLAKPIETVLSNQELLFSQRVTLAISGSVPAGFLGVVPRLDFADRVFGGLIEGDELLWLDTYCPTLSTTEDPLFGAVLAGASIKMLAIDPSADNCGFRAQEIEEMPFSEAVFRSEAQQGLDHLREHARLLGSPTTKGSLEIRLYRGLPCVPMYLRLRRNAVQAGYTSFFLTRATYHEPHIAWGPTTPPGPTGFLEKFDEYFRHRWNLAADPTDRFLRWPDPAKP